ncbi:Hypothetical protein ETEE_1145 [Edwardsiella anguillarum ET080813]|uniref:Inner membrane protein n=1 Tax=Edwardsiella anguillarum ET080813 TaxID=667120 RepID=A0A076LLN8_9GAMM|nr:Hypothetical protein ETEE_1145 [Edwardsiella anguillarum ET080813]
MKTLFLSIGLLIIFIAMAGWCSHGFLMLFLSVSLGVDIYLFN